MSIELKILSFVVISAGLVWLSRRLLRAYRSHGFYRLLSWEVLLVLILLNIDCFFVNPFSNPQIISWILLFLSAVYVAYGTITLAMWGRASNLRDDPLLIGIEKTTNLVRVGPYKYIRHPIYSSIIFGAWGVFFKNVSWYGLPLAIVVTVLTIETSLSEEAENIQYFGNEYLEYKKQTKMFIPFIV